MVFLMKSTRNFGLQPKIYHTLVIFIIFLLIFMQFGWIDARECPTMDIRNKPESFKQLTNCTVIRGSLIIVLMTDQNLTKEDFQPYSFPELREITEFMMVYQVLRLTTLRQLFPNLVVIRGEKLFLNYALTINDVPHLSEVGLVSLVAIQRGHIYIKQCPMLCFVDTIDWANITESYGAGDTIHQANNNCPKRNSCRGCRVNSCWSSKNCQKFKDDNLLHLASPVKCHPLCLGGCKNSTAAGCNVCKGISDRGVCVEKCPNNKVLIPEYFRCYTHQQCKYFNRLIHKNECVTACPAGFSTKDLTTGKDSETRCFPCKDRCSKICESNAIKYLWDAESFKGCTIINGPLHIRIRNRISQNDLKQHLSSIEEIYGYLKIWGTSSISSLSFLPKLKKIHGQELHYNKYALVIYFNQNLVDLWPDDEEKNLVLGHGGMFIHSNYKLCSLKIQKFQNDTVHDQSLDYIPKAKIEPSCNPIKIETSYKVLGIHTVSIRWKELDNTSMTGSEYILSYANTTENNTAKSETNGMCYEDTWITQLVLEKEVARENDYYVYNLTNLKQYTKYAFYVKAYKEGSFASSESDIQYFTTEPDTPFQQTVQTRSKTQNTITISWLPRPNEHDLINYYVIDLFHAPDKQDILDARNFCIEQIRPEENAIDSKNMVMKCCGKEIKVSKVDYHYSFHHKLGEKYHCLVSDKGECQNRRYSNQIERPMIENSTDFEGLSRWPAPKQDTFVKTMYIVHDEKRNYTITGLEPFNLYIIHFYACNNITKCGTYALHSDRTRPDPQAGRVVVKSFVSAETQFAELEFDEPVKSNGLTVAYHINLKPAICKTGKKDCTDTVCITRLDHELANYRYVIDTKESTYQVRVRSISLAGYGPYSDWIKVDLSNVPKRNKTISWIWYVLTVIMASGVLHCLARWRKRADRVELSAIIRYRYTDRDELLLNM